MPAARRKKQEDEPKQESFTALFLALMIILLAFFIMLNSMATLEADRIQRALRSIQTAYGGLGVFGEGVSLDTESKEIADSKPSVIVMDKMYDLINQSLVKWGKNKTWVQTYEDERRLVISMKDLVTFYSGSAAMNPRVWRFLDEIGDLVKQVGIPVTVQGHSDSTGGGEESAANWTLSARRATEVAQYLISGVGIPAQIVEAEAFGDTQPVASNDTEEGRAQNRRVDLVFYKRDLAKLAVKKQ